MPHVNELHSQHDSILVVSLASGDLATVDRDFATATFLVESCAECAELHDDVLAVARATKALPPAVRTRDFRISPEQAAKLSPSGWPRFVAGLAAPGGLFSRQVGVGLATLGIAGLLLTALPSLPVGMGGAAASPAPVAGAPAYESLETDDTFQAFGPAPAPTWAPDHLTTALGGGASPPAASAAPEVDTAASSATVTTSGEAAAGRNNATAKPIYAADGQTTPEPVAQVPTAPSESGSSGGPSGLAIVSTVLLLAGLVLLIGRRLSRRASSS